MGFLANDADLGIEFERIVRADLGAEPVPERGDDAPRLVWSSGLALATTSTSSGSRRV